MKKYTLQRQQNDMCVSFHMLQRLGYIMQAFPLSHANKSQLIVISL